MVWEIALAFFLMVFAILIIYLIPTVFEFRRTLGKLADVAETVQKDLPHILQNLNHISTHITAVSEKLNGVVADIVEIEQQISKEIKAPILEAAATFGGIIKGLQTFMTFFLKKKK